MAEHLLSTAVHRTMPVNYARPESQRPRLAEVVSGARIPVVDLACPDRAAVVADIGAACRSHGFFQVLNHGIDAGLVADVMAVAREFFRLPAEEKAKLYSDDPARKIRLSTSFNVRKETVHNWRDYLRLHCHPLDQFVPDWPSNPPDFKETMTTYCKEVRELGFRLYPAISESLIGLEPSYTKETPGGEQENHHMAVNFYPSCPSPSELAYGGLLPPPHSEPNALAILLMDPAVAGLQVLDGGNWVAVNRQPAALLVNIGDKLQLKNGFLHAVVKRSGGLCVDATALLREPGMPPHLAHGLEALDPNGIDPPFVETLVVIGGVGEQGALYYNDSGHETDSAMAEVLLGTRSSTYAVQVRVDESVVAKPGDPIGWAGSQGTREDDGRGNGHRGGSGTLSAVVVGIVAASSAVTSVVAAGAVAPAVAFGSFLVLLTGLSLAAMTTVAGG